MSSGDGDDDFECGADGADGVDGADGDATWTKIMLFSARARMTEVTATKLCPFSTRVVNVLTCSRNCKGSGKKASFIRSAWLNSSFEDK